MAKVTIRNLMAVHVRAARALLGMSTREFAHLAGEGMTINKVKALELGRPVHDKTKKLILDAIEQAGIELQNGGKPGARVVETEAYQLAVSTILECGKATPNQ